MRRPSMSTPGLAAIAAVSLLGYSAAQPPEPGPADSPAAISGAKAKIVPLVTVRPGETKAQLLSTFCTVGITRSGGLSVSEMRGGVARPGAGKSYGRDGVTVTVPGFAEAEAFAASPAFAALKGRGVEAFEVTIKAAADAKPGLLELHLSDETCSGDCGTDLRVLVLRK